MHVGDSCRIVIPYTMGYGSYDMGTILQPYSMLQFDLKLVDIYAYKNQPIIPSPLPLNLRGLPSSPRSCLYKRIKKSALVRARKSLANYISLRSLRKSARIKPTARHALPLHSSNLVQGERRPSLLEFAEPQPRFNEVTLHSSLFTLHSEKEVCVTSRQTHLALENYC